MNESHPKLKDIRVRQAIRSRSTCRASSRPPSRAAGRGRTRSSPRTWGSATGPTRPSTSATSTTPRSCCRRRGSRSWRCRSPHRGDGLEDVAQVVQANLTEVGIDVSLKLVDSATFYELGKQLRERELFYVGFVTQPDPSWSFVWFTCEQIDVWNWQYWCDERVRPAALRRAEGDRRGQAQRDVHRDAAALGRRGRTSSGRTSRRTSSGTQGDRAGDRARTAASCPLAFRARASRRPSGADGPLHRQRLAMTAIVVLLSMTFLGVLVHLVPGRSGHDDPRPARERGAVADGAGGDGPRRAGAGAGLELRHGRRSRATSARTSSAACRSRRCSREALPHTIILGAAQPRPGRARRRAARRLRGHAPERLDRPHHRRGLGLADHAPVLRGRAVPAAALRVQLDMLPAIGAGRVLRPRRLPPAPGPARPSRWPSRGSATSPGSCARACSRCSVRTTSAPRAPSACASA